MSELSDILKRLQPALGAPRSEPVPLEGGITNRNYRVRLGDTDYVIRLPGRETSLLGIDRSSERIANIAAAELGIAPRVAAELESCLVTEYVACAAIGQDELSERAGEVGRALRRFHDAPLSLPVSFRISKLLDDYAEIVSTRGGELPAEYAHAVATAARIESALPLPEARPCHNDLLAGNIIRAALDGRLMLVDWEYAGMGDPYFDLGNLAVNNALDARAEDRLLGAYHAAPPSDHARAALKLMRVLSDVREAAWGVVQGVLSELDFDFAAYGREHFNRLREASESPAFEEWLALAASERRTSAQTA